LFRQLIFADGTVGIAAVFIFAQQLIIVIEEVKETTIVL
jgi:hypothetical protein